MRESDEAEVPDAADAVDGPDVSVVGEGWSSCGGSPRGTVVTQCWIRVRLGWVYGSCGETSQVRRQ